MAESRDSTAEHARAAAQFEADVGVEHIAEVYAKGLLDAAAQASQTAAVVNDFDAVTAQLLDRFPKWEEVLASGLISPDDKAATIDRVLKGRVSSILVNFLKVVARHGRLDCLRAIHWQVHVRYDAMHGRIPVRLSTAAPCSLEEIEKIAESLRVQLGGEPVFQQETDPNLIGGAVLRIGDTVYDGSIANQLQNLRQQMVERSAHEIQSRRDRFRDPAGN